MVTIGYSDGALYLGAHQCFGRWFANVSALPQTVKPDSISSTTLWSGVAKQGQTKLKRCANIPISDRLPRLKAFDYGPNKQIPNDRHFRARIVHLALAAGLKTPSAAKLDNNEQMLTTPARLHEESQQQRTITVENFPQAAQESAGQLEESSFASAIVDRVRKEKHRMASVYHSLSRESIQSCSRDGMQGVRISACLYSISSG
ncbi:hypothetical protein ZHAS_00007927 [Anopheles sinensis]|uniref:Uncharacterized protein n=1 Tax=Anopheles sinensis TaxID=74873 RepID=A0A084VR54_ANOSI|nr:hypothetical protein ZHAS_00007927 [Anopheles sinensis]